MSSGTAFGAYLYQLRIGLGIEKIADFIRDLVLPFSDNYYRDVEAGRKTLSVDSAIQLYHALRMTDADAVDYFWHYFKDVLPEDLHETLFGKRVRIAEGRLRDINELRAYDSAVQRKALALARYEREFVADESIAESFQNNFDLLPVMTYLYMVERASELELRRVCEKIDVVFDRRVEDFVKLISHESVVGDVRYFSRRAPVLRMPRNDVGIKLKDRFLEFEVAKSIDKPESGEMFPDAGTFRYSSMVAIPAEALAQVQDRISDLVSELEVADKTGDQLDNASSSPYFFALIVSGRPEYDGRT